MTQNPVWTPRYIAFLLYFRDEYRDEEGQQLTFNFIADLFGREIGFYTNRYACIGAYNRFKDRSSLYPVALIQDYLVGMDTVYSGEA